MSYIEQSADSIRLYAATGEPDIKQFVILKESAFKNGDFTINFGILGASHFIKISSDTQSFTEICACVEGKFSAKDNLIVSSKLNQMATNHFSSPEHGYEFYYEKITGKEVDAKLTELRDITSPESTHSISLQFSGKYFFSQKPVTEVHIQSQNNVIIAKTVHTYPNEDAAVFTKSSFTLKST